MVNPRVLWEGSPHIHQYFFMELIPHARRGLGVHTSSFIRMKSLQCYTVLILRRGVATLGMSPSDASTVKSVPSPPWEPVFYTDLISLRKVKVMASV